MPFVRAIHCFGALAGSAFLAFPAAAQQLDVTDFVEAWLSAPHGDYRSRSFTYWNDEGEVPVECAACHSEPGFIDYLGADGSEALVVDQPATINSPIGCPACHTPAAHTLDDVPFPSGVVVAGVGASAVCNVCHQGRASGDAVQAAIEGIPEDVVGPQLSFINPHYDLAAAVMHGEDVHGGYQYPGLDYAGRFEHVPSASTCTDCHDAHSTELATEACFACHRGVEDVRAIRTRHEDFDGDGERHAGIQAEITGLHDLLYRAIQTYADEVAGAPITYAPGQFPYFFSDLDEDGRIDDEETAMPNRYDSWTPRLLKAAYNYQVAAKDPGAYAHNPAYVLQLLYDSIVSLSAEVDLDTAALQRP